MKPKKKYNFYTGKETKRIKRYGYKYLGKGEIGKIESYLVDKERIYYLVGFNGFGRLSPHTKDKTKFKKVEFWEEDFGGRRKWFESQDAIIKQKPKNKIEILTKIGCPKGKGMFMDRPEIRFNKKDYVSFFDLSDSILIRELQLQEGNKLKITIEKINKK